MEYILLWRENYLLDKEKKKNTTNFVTYIRQRQQTHQINWDQFEGFSFISFFYLIQHIIIASQHEFVVHLIVKYGNGTKTVEIFF